MNNKEGVATMQVVYLVGFTLLFCLSAVTAEYQEVVLVAKSDESNAGHNQMQTYIVFVEKPISQKSPEELESWYQSFLPETSGNSNQLLSSRLVHAYRNVATGFAARLTPKELKAMKKKKGFISAHPERIRPLLTTHSPAFLGLHQGSGLWEQANYGEGVIIGMLDTGITPDHPSFNEEGMPPPPAKWKGKCEYNLTLCNNKLIGAKNFIGAGKGNVTKRFPFDIDGHGTHTSSTAAGRFVQGASFYGQANGTAAGIAPNAHLAMYKVCAGFGCADGDILAALDAAVDDGVDILSLSLGGPSIPFYEDVIAIGAFAATQKGIFFSCAGGNSGPWNGSLSNEAPWILTVGASTTDRILNFSSAAAGTILSNGSVDALAPKVASFSSRGPNTASPGILKPDIIGPGVDILAAWPRSVDNVTYFSLLSGTSMACPHLSGTAALLKSSHPDWSPAAIKSAIMTTADLLNLAGTPIVDEETLQPANVFSIGAGHVNPTRANDPGLVYDTQLGHYIQYLCGLKYTDKQIKLITQKPVKCSQVGAIPEAQLNYPSFSIKMSSKDAQSQYYTRTVRNVGPANSTYTLDLLVPHKMGMSVNPDRLIFTGVNQDITFHVEFLPEDGAGQDGVTVTQGYLKWVSDTHTVTSPIAVIFT